MIRGAERAILFGCELSSMKQSESITHHIREAMHLPCPHTVVWATPHAWSPIPCLLITYSSRAPLWEASPMPSALSVLHLSLGSCCPSCYFPFLGIHPSSQLVYMLAPQVRDGPISLCIPRVWRWEGRALTIMLQEAQQNWEYWELGKPSVLMAYPELLS